SRRERRIRRKSPHRFLRRIEDLAAQDPKHGIYAEAGNNVSPMLFHLGNARLAKDFVPSSHNRRRDSCIYEQLDPSVGIIEELRIDLLEFRVPTRASLIVMSRVNWGLLVGNQACHNLHDRESFRFSVCNQLLKTFPTQAVRQSAPPGIAQPVEWCP